MSDLLIERNGSMLVLTLNRPESLNAFSAEMIGLMTEQFQLAGQDETVKAIVLKGAGRSFSAGGDVKGMGQGGPQDIYNHVGRLNECIIAMQKLEKPIIAAVHGFAAGAGFNLALACDFIIAEENSKFVLSFSQVGLISDGGGLYFLPRVASPQKIKEWLFLAEPITAQEAYQCGFINRIVPQRQMEEEVTVFAGRLARGPLKAYGKMKAILNDSYQMTVEEVLERERLTQMLMIDTDDHFEGVAAFKEKRKPVFEGR
ncbi:MAG TPA: enoyl-CoA hydratase [Chondromyces sp.]|nr:enoyl-CoA hydratase [Chondromyces sp.]